MTRVSLAIAIAIIVMGGVVAVRSMQNESALEDGIGKLENADHFTTSTEAGNTIANISVKLRQDGAACRHSDKGAARCSAVLSAAAYAAVTAYTVLDCTAPGVYDGRIAMLKYLRAVRAFTQGKGAAPSVPKVTTC